MHAIFSALGEFLMLIFSRFVQLCLYSTSSSLNPKCVYTYFTLLSSLRIYFSNSVFWEHLASTEFGEAFVFLGFVFVLTITSTVAPLVLQWLSFQWKHWLYKLCSFFFLMLSSLSAQHCHLSPFKRQKSWRLRIREAITWKIKPFLIFLIDFITLLLLWMSLIPVLQSDGKAQTLGFNLHAEKVRRKILLRRVDPFDFLTLRWWLKKWS